MMTAAEVRAALERWARVKIYCEERTKEVNEYKELMEAAAGLRPAILDDMPHGTQKSDTTQTAALELIKMQERYDRMLERLRLDIERETAFQERVDAAVNRLPEKCRRVIECRYKKRLSVVKTGFEIGYSQRSVNRIEKSAILMLSKWL